MNNPVLENINNRRSVRNFTNKEISKEILETIIKAGNMAPSGSNVQPWRFVVITDPSARQKLAELALPRYSEWLGKADPQMQERRREVDKITPDPIYYSAPAIIFVIGQGTFNSFDCPMVCENMMLAARSLGIGSCWVFFGQLIIDNPEIRQLLELKADEKVFGPLVLGYPKDGVFPPCPPKKDANVKWV